MFPMNARSQFQMKRWYFLLAALWLTIPLTGQDSTLIPRDLLFQPKDIYHIELAKNGRRVYFQRHSAGNKALFCLDAEKPNKELRFSARGRILDWVPTHDDQLLVYLIDDAKQRKLHLLDRDGSFLKDLTPFRLRSLRLEALSREVPDRAAVWVIAQNADNDGIYILDLEKNKAERVCPRQGFDQRYYDGRLRLVAARRENAAGGNSFFLKKGEEWKPLFEFPFDEGMFIGGLQQVVSVSADGKRLFLTSNLGSDKTVLLEYEVDSSRQRVLVADPKVDILPYGAIVGPDGWPEMVLGTWAGAQRHYLHGETRRDFEWLDKELGGEASFVTNSDDNRTWLVRRLSGGPIRYFLFKRGKRTVQPLFSDFPALDSFPLAERHNRTVLTRDSLELPIHVYLPAGSDEDQDGRPDTLLPTILYVHGGPWVGVTHWNSWFHNRNFQLLANRGYVVINTEFRGTTGLGKTVTRLGDREWGRKMHHDLMDIRNWAIQDSIADPGRIGIWGWSYGGYAAAAALAFAPDRFSCGISMYGPADLDAFSRIPFTNSDRWRSTVGDPFTEEGTAMLREQSPFHNLEAIQRPLLLSTGAKDDRIPKPQVDTFAQALVNADKEVVYFYYPEEGHDYQEAESWVSFWAIAERFLSDYLGGRRQTAGEDLKKGNFVVVFGKEYVEGME